jgi:HSP20 family protein
MGTLVTRPEFIGLTISFMRQRLRTVPSRSSGAAMRQKETHRRRKGEDMTSTLTRWEPLRELEDLQNRLSSVFSRAPVRRENGREDITLADWAPLADITEDEKEYVIKAELPEIPPESVKVTVENGVLTISGERTFEKEEKGKKYHRVERAYGSFVRAFTLPEDAQPDKIRADFKEGMLSIHLPKSEQAKPKQIEVRVAHNGNTQAGETRGAEQRQQQRTANS